MVVVSQSGSASPPAFANNPFGARCFVTRCVTDGGGSTCRAQRILLWRVVTFDLRKGNFCQAGWRFVKLGKRGGVSFEVEYHQ